MLSREDNELLTRVGPGTPMGTTMRRYWIPALLARELPEPDGPPVRVRLLGEDLVAFRDTRGRVGLLDELCPHRRASLFFGRNEECGLRCVYHGWKFDVDGRCVDMMNEPDDAASRTRSPPRPTPRVELGGVVWAYLGPAEPSPPLPALRVDSGARASHRQVSKVIQESNWLQGLEGGIDTSHAPILHRLLTDEPRGRASSPTTRSFAAGRQRWLSTRPTTATVTRASGRWTRRASTFGRITSSCRSIRSAPRARSAAFRWWPATSGCRSTTRTRWSTTGSTAPTDEPLSEEDRLERRLGNGPLDVDQTTFRSKRNRRNNYLLDRHVQKTESFTGIDGINTQDRAIQESMGAIVDRSREHLGPADRAIIQARRLLLEAVRSSPRAAPRAASRPRTAPSPPRKRCFPAAPTGGRSWPTTAGA